MARRPLSPCRAKLCAALTRERHGYCEDHADMAKPWARSKSNGRGGRPWRRLRAQVLERDRYLCQCDQCRAEGRAAPAHEVDHVRPVAEGGDDSAANLRAINADCHKRKTLSEAQRAQRTHSQRPGGG